MSHSTTLEANQTVTSLNLLLADFQLYYQNLRYAHWNVKGPQFLTLHTKFEQLYTDAALTIDSLAERILALGSKPLSFFTDYLGEGSIKEAKGAVTAQEMVKTVVENLRVLAGRLRDLMSHPIDPATDSLISDLLVQLEKETWMLTAYLGE
jgi:starvation-inducible DNA-binding protein